MANHLPTAAGVAIVAIAAFFTGCGGMKPSGPAATSEQDKAEINKTRNAYVSAWKAADADRMTGLYTADASVLYPNQPAVAGHDAILAYFKSFFAEFGQQDFELTSAEIEVADPWAFDRGTYRWRAVPRAGGDPIEDHGKYLVILQRQADGSWKVARDMDNSDRPLTQSARSAG
jgi:uncharacterized protein (TIGR02246 family)